MAMGKDEEELPDFGSEEEKGNHEEGKEGREKEGKKKEKMEKSHPATMDRRVNESVAKKQDRPGSHASSTCRTDATKGSNATIGTPRKMITAML